jgi:hypothetical protein
MIEWLAAAATAASPPWATLYRTKEQVSAELHATVKSMSPGIVRLIVQALAQLVTKNQEWKQKFRAHLEVLMELSTKLDKMIPKPRNADRDKEIVRDERKLTFGEIPRELKKLNSTWAGRGRNLLSRDTVEKAYHRKKTKPKH